jgi:pilus assembly protein Flp/PilA
MRQTMIRLMCDEGGATAIEYALIASLIAATIVGAIVTIGQSVGNIFNSVAAGF